MDPRLWGPPAWRLLHTLAHHVAKKRDRSLFGEMHELLYGLGYILPCSSCRKNIRVHLARMPPLRRAADLPRWVYDLHQLVNQATAVPEQQWPSFSQIDQMYQKKLDPTDVAPFLEGLVRDHPGGRWLARGGPYHAALRHLVTLLPLVMASFPSRVPGTEVLLSRPRFRAWVTTMLSTSPGP